VSGSQIQPTDIRPVLHCDHPPTYARTIEGSQFLPVGRGSVFGRRRHAAAHECLSSYGLWGESYKSGPFVFNVLANADIVHIMRMVAPLRRQAGGSSRPCAVNDAWRGAWTSGLHRVMAPRPHWAMSVICPPPGRLSKIKRPDLMGAASRELWAQRVTDGLGARVAGALGEQDDVDTILMLIIARCPVDR
jgi:hypothetical protein